MARDAGRGEDVSVREGALRMCMAHWLLERQSLLMSMIEVFTYVATDLDSLSNDDILVMILDKGC